MQGLFKYQNKIFTKKDVKDALKLLGINTGDIVCMHTDIRKLGKPIVKKNDFLNALLDCFYEVLGESGTLIMPTFTYSFCDGLVYDKQNSPTKMGVLNEFFRKQPNVERTNDPIFSFAIWGAKKDLFLKDVDSCFGVGSVYDEFIKAGGKYVFLDASGAHTMVHYIEEELKVEYRYHKNFDGILIDDNGVKYNKTIKYFVRNLNINSQADTISINNIVRATQSFVMQMLGGTEICVFDAQEYKQAIINAIKKDPYAIILENSK